MTHRGRTLVVLAVGAFVFGRLLGMRELIMVGSALALALAVGAITVRVRSGRFAVARRLHPSRTTVGRDVRVELGVRAAGWLGSGPVLLTDKLAARLGNSPRLALPATNRRERFVAYAFRPRLRGRYNIGPVEVTHTDPFGALQRRQTVGDRSPLIVYPAFDEVSVLPAGLHRLGSVRHSPLVGTGDEFYALRDYEEGDDLRKVHWPTSARRGHLVVRQNELLAEPRVIVVLDTSAKKHRGRGPSSSMEAAVSACASIAVAALRKRMRLQVITVDGPLLGSPTPTEHQLLEALAELQANPERDLETGLEAADTTGRVTVAVVITPGLRRGEVRALASLTHKAAGGAVVRVVASSFAATSPQRGRQDASRSLGLPILDLRSQDRFGTIWQQGLRDVALAR